MTWLVLVPSHAEARHLSRAVGPGGQLEVCGIGPVAAAVGTAALLAAHGPRPCLLVGVAGTRDPERAPLGSVVAATALRNEAIGAGAGENFVPLGELGLDEPDLPPDLLELTPSDVLAACGGAVQPGVVGTVAAASSGADQAAARSRRHPDVLVEDMESHPVGWVAQTAGAPLTVLRAVSNVAGDRDKAHWDMTAALRSLADLVARLTADPWP